MQQEGSLRAIANRLNVTPVEELPRISGFLATSLANCSLESLFADSKTNGSSVTVHKIKTRISSLLQDRSAAGRLTAVVLIKAIVENAGQSGLGASESWVRGLLSCLNKPDPVEVKKLYLVAITRIFLLTQNHPKLLREITTPLLPPFIAATLSLIKPIQAQIGKETKQTPSLLLEPVLECYVQLLPQHASVFRPFLNRIKPICQSLLGSSATSSSTRDVATDVLCLSLLCAPKHTLSQEWTQTALTIIDHAHETASKVFRAIIEEHDSNDSAHQRPVEKQDFSQGPKQAENDALGLGPWSGISDGHQRLECLITWLERLISTATSQSVSIPTGAILDLTSRIMAIAASNDRATVTSILKFNKEASREEKDELWMNLPQHHLACLRLLHIMCTTYTQSLFPVYQTIASHVLTLFSSMSWHESIRRIVYDIFGHLLENSNIQDLALNRFAFSRLITQCCDDLRIGIPSIEVGSIDAVKDRNSKVKSSLLAGENFQGKVVERCDLSGYQPNAFRAAWRLLAQVLMYCPTSLITRQLRVEMDRLSVLLDHQDAMLTSVMHPVLLENGKASMASLLPFLARSGANSLTVEALLRPRMPVTQTDGLSLAEPKDPHSTVEYDKGEGGHAQPSHILSQPENSLKELGGSPNGSHAPPVSTNGQCNRLESRSTAARKRPFDDCGGNLSEGGGSVSEETDSTQLKKLRVEESSTSDLAPPMGANTKSDAVTVNTISASAFSSAKADDLETTSKPLAPKGIQEGSDSSDFEIPKIDTGFDTDEEEEDELE
ncbi:uncharacterized protein Z518_01016 [Rhinocladiella mackenziei CBS 650.93]|uniref:Pre-rRNA-processing protein RIX1 n=1 Tax=Rhinocladiella mackenziei CBS 650.93 TaxID=1442369 RepID=A0A0D2JKC4_9EURO|nr:uncharacterized protein Z518_01016 [Rhinocladiella mackenziei CBS 650.93]KIX09935.1 hypothetical protein Z518_01016 [Rhinocladiella mackenziei CBS 650.93]